MLKQLHTLLKKVINGGVNHSENDVESMHLAIAALLCQVSSADHHSDEKEEIAKLQLLSKLFDINDEQAKTLLASAKEKSKASTSLYEFTTKLRALMPDERFNLIKAMWAVAYADGVVDPIEESIIRQAADLLYLSHSEFIRAKLAAAK